jgi:predicted phage terminase large subunit-like protein
MRKSARATRWTTTAATQAKGTIDAGQKEAYLSKKSQARFYPFVAQAFADTHASELESRNFVKYLCEKVEPSAKKCRGKVLVNTPPKNLKSFIMISCLTAWMLGRNSCLDVLIVAGNQVLARGISRWIRRIMSTPGYARTFETQLKKSTTTTSFETTDGGTVSVVTIGQHFTGASSDVVLVDDLVDIADAGNQRILRETNSNYDQKILTRRKLGVNSFAAVVMHRLDEHDLSGHLLAKGGWEHISVPFEAEENRAYRAGAFVWRRAKGDRLRPNSYDDSDMARIKDDDAPPGYQALFQQRPEGPPFDKFDESCFGEYSEELRATPRVISVDPAQSDDPDADSSVIQVWTFHNGFHVLLDELCDQLEPEALERALLRMCRAYRPSVALIEKNGPVASLTRRIRKLVPIVKKISVENKSKRMRLAPFVELIRGGGIKLHKNLRDPEDFIEELTDFPDYPHDDRVDAMTQYLAYYKRVAGKIPAMPEHVVGVRALYGAHGAIQTRLENAMRVDSYKYCGQHEADFLTNDQAGSRCADLVVSPRRLWSIPSERMLMKGAQGRICD